MSANHSTIAAQTIANPMSKHFVFLWFGVHSGGGIGVHWVQLHPHPKT